MQQKFLVQIDLDLDSEEFDVNVINKNPRKGFVDMDRLTSKLHEVMQFMQNEGLDDLISLIQKDQLN